MSIARLLKWVDDPEKAAFRTKAKTIQEMEESGDEVAQAAVKRLREKFSLTDLGDGELFWERNVDEDILNQLKLERDISESANRNFMDAEQQIFAGKMPEGTSPIANAFDTSAEVSGIALPNQLTENWQTLNKMPERLNLNLTPKHWNTMPTLAWSNKEIDKGLKQLMFNPKYAFEDLSRDLVETPSLFKYQEDAFGKHARDTFEALTKPLSRAERREFNNILREGNDAEDVFKPVAGGLQDSNGNFFPVSDKVQEAYFGTRMLLDHMHWVINGAAIRQARSKNYKVFSAPTGDEPIEVLSRKVSPDINKTYQDIRGNSIQFSPEFIENGWELHELKLQSGNIRAVAMSPDDILKYTKEIPDDFKMVPFRKGYVPVIYKDPFHIHEIRKMKDGTFQTKRIATANSRKKANEAVNNLRENKVLDEETENIEYLWARKNDGSVDVDFNDGVKNILDNLSQSEIEALRATLIKMGLSPEEAAVFEKTGKFFSHKTNSYMKRRGAERLKSYDMSEDAPMLPADEAIYKYMQNTASYQAHAEYMGLMEREYLKEFGGLLENPNNFHSRVKWGHTASNGRTALEAYLVRSQMYRIAGLPSHLDKVVQKAVDSTVDKFFESKTGKLMSELIDTAVDTMGIRQFVLNPNVNKAVASAKSFGAAVKLGVWNLGQLGIQSTSMLNVIGRYTPNVTAKAYADMVAAIGPEILKIGRTSYGRKLYEAIDQSGFIAGFDYVNLQKMAAKGNPTIMGSSRMKKILDTHMIPYQLGEGGVRALAWFAERNKLINDIRAGKHTKFGTGDIDSFEFLQEVSRGAMVPALNMSRMNQPLIARGILGMPFQFKQFVIQQAEFMLNSKNFNSHWAQAATIGAWAGAFGIQGIPFIFDLLVATEGLIGRGAEFIDENTNIKVNAPEFSGYLRRSGQELIDTLSKPIAKELAQRTGRDYNEIRAFAQRFASSGIGSAISQGEFNIASRASLARVFTEYYGNTTLDDMIGGPGYQTARMLITNNVSNISELLEMWRNNEEFTNDKLMRLIVSGTQGVPGLTNPAQAIEAAKTGKWKSPDGRLILNEPTLVQDVLIGVGFQPGKRGERFERLEFSQKYKEALGRHLKRRVDKISSLISEGNTETATELFDATVADFSNTDPRVLRQFYPLLNRALIGKNLDEEEKELYYGITDALFINSDADNIMMLGDKYAE